MAHRYPLTRARRDAYRAGHAVRMGRRLLMAMAGAFAIAAPANGQDTGLRLGLTYASGYRPGVAVLAFESPDNGRTGVEAANILRNDLLLSDRFEVSDLTQSSIGSGALSDAGVVWVVTGSVDASGRLSVAVRDVVYDRAVESADFLLPPAGSAGWRMSVHAVADEIVRWTTGKPGMAASRIVFTRGDPPDLWVVDADGQDLRPLTTDGSWIMSPSWSPEGDRIAYASYRDGTSAIWILDLPTGRAQRVAGGDGTNSTPAFGADRLTLAFAASPRGRTSIHIRDPDGVREIAPTTLQDAISPTFSPDGRRLLYVSNRMGRPHLFMHDMESGRDRLFSTFAFNPSAYIQAPDWSPTGERIAFHMRIEGRLQIAMVDTAGTAVRFLTATGRNEDPSWAPDGRHVVYRSDSEAGLWIIDSRTGKRRRLVAGDARLPDWSPALLRAQY